MRSIPVPDPYNLYFTPDGRKAIVVAESLQRLDFRAPRSWRLIRSVPIPAPGPDHLDFSTDGRSLVLSCEFSGTWRVGGSPDMLQVSLSGHRLWFSNRFDRTVAVVSTTTGQLVHTIPVAASPHGLAYFPQQGHHNLGHNGVYR